MNTPDANSPTPFPSYIRTAAQLRDLCHHLRGEGLCALDTEFIQEVTYYPRLEIVQVADYQGATIVDCRQEYDLDPLFELLFDPAVVKVLHASGADIALFYLLTGRVVENFFDTQTAAAFLGMGHQIGYANLVQKVCGQRLHKQETRSDWSARPLSAGQVRYALEDVLYLPAIYDWQQEQLQLAGRLEWMQDEMAHLREPQRYCPPEPADAGRRIPGRKKLNKRGRWLLDRVAAWREEEARRSNQRPRRILRDDVLVEIARTTTTDAAQIRAFRSRSAGRPSQQDELLAGLVTQALAEYDPASVPDEPREERPTSETEVGIAHLLSTLVKVRGEHLGIAPSSLARSEQLGHLLALHAAGRQQESELLQGWRREAIGMDLVNLLDGRGCLRIVNGQITLA